MHVESIIHPWGVAKYISVVLRRAMCSHEREFHLLKKKPPAVEINGVTNILTAVNFASTQVRNK